MKKRTRNKGSENEGPEKKGRGEYEKLGDRKVALISEETKSFNKEVVKTSIKDFKELETKLKTRELRESGENWAIEKVAVRKGLTGCP